MFLNYSTLENILAKVHDIILTDSNYKFESFWKNVYFYEV